MHKKLAALALGASAMLSLAACSATPGIPAINSKIFGDNAVVGDSGLGGDRTAVINFLPASEGGFNAQAIVHRWVVADVTAYDVTLSAGGNVLSAVSVLPQSGQSKAVFSYLRLGTTYTVTVVAKGKNQYVNGGAEQIINALTPTTGTILFSGHQDVENTQTLNLKVKLDDVTFDGSATASIIPTDGNYLPPTASESGAVN